MNSDYSTTTVNDLKYLNDGRATEQYTSTVSTRVLNLNLILLKKQWSRNLYFFGKFSNTYNLPKHNKIL